MEVLICCKVTGVTGMEFAVMVNQGKGSLRYHVDGHFAGELWVTRMLATTAIILLCHVLLDLGNGLRNSTAHTAGICYLDIIIFNAELLSAIGTLSVALGTVRVYDAAYSGAH